MTAKEDLLGRGPIMRKVQPAPVDEHVPFRRKVGNGLASVSIPYGTTYSGVSTFNTVTVPAFPWEKGDG